MSRNVLILMSDTGGGHRACAEAIAEALTLEYGDRVRPELVDVFQEYAPYPFNRFPEWYPVIVRRGSRAWARGFRISDGPRRSRVLSMALWPYVRGALRRLVREHAADLTLCVHPLLIMPAVRAYGRSRPPFVTVVTDLVSAHAWWYYPRVDKCLVPTDPARERALRCGLPPEKISVTGLPVAQKFVRARADQLTLRQQLGWRDDLPAVLIVGGGEGMGPVYAITREVAQAGLRCQVAVVAGRNETLRAQLEQAEWPTPVHVYGFVTNMPDLMGAADVLVTKAGPSSVVEGLTAGLPLVLSGKIPGQEDGNVDYVVSQGAGVWAPGPARVQEALARWLGAPEGRADLRRTAENARRIARPEAARLVAREVGEQLGL